MEISNTKLEMPKWVCILGIALGAVALAVQAFVDCYQNVSPDMDHAAFWGQIWNMTLPTGFALVFASMSGSLLRVGRWKHVLAGACMFVLVAGYMIYTATNSMDFLANQTVLRTQTQIRKATSDKDIAEIRNQLAISERKERQENLWRTYMSAKGSDKDKALAEIKAAGQETLDLKQTDISVVQIGVGGTAQRFFGWRPEAIQEVKAIAFPILVMIGKMLGITLGFAFYPATAADAWKTASPLRVSREGFQETTRKLSLSYEDACMDLRAMVAAGAGIDSQRELADRWGVSKGQVTKWKPKFRRDGIPFDTVANGNKRAIVAAPHHNGNGRVLGNA
jgi:hypothetical protein